MKAFKGAEQMKTYGPQFKTRLVKISRSGPDGNAFVVMGNCAEALREAGATNEEVDAYIAEAKAATNYEDLLDVSANWCNFKVTR
jgi:hypothetical protein